MRILYLISPDGKGMGGHNHSFRTVLGALGREVDCLGVGVGTVASPVHALSGQRTVALVAKPFSIGDLWQQLLPLARAEQPDIIHAFDPNSYFFGRRLGMVLGRPTVLTKCGGPNPMRYFPRAEDLVLFSQENLDYFQHHPGFHGSRLHLIPNRVEEVSPNPALVSRLRAAMPGAGPIFLRICRICPFHEESVLQLTRLVGRLRREGCPARLLVIGFVLDDACRARIERALGPGDRLETGMEYTRNASEVLDVGDFVLGTGRSFMEAACRSRILLAPLEGVATPALVTPANADQLFRSNFSQRGRIEGFSEEENYAEIKRAVTDPRRVGELRAHARTLFEKYFSIASAVPRYLSIYRNLEGRKTKRSRDFYRHWAEVLLREVLMRRGRRMATAEATPAE